ncbi:MAG TPA: hypothetical protein VMW19_17500 [Myxococcota bacterium]|nr:hypothetical protein [Myxococcota bacterium]
MRTIRNLLRVTGAAGIFAAGYFCGALVQPAPADAQVGDLMKKAEGAGGTLGTAAKLGTTITDMQKNVDGLNQNIKVLNEIKTALGG